MTETPTPPAPEPAPSPGLLHSILLRPVAELLLIMLGVTVAVAMLGAGAAITAYLLLNPDREPGSVTKSLIDALTNTLFIVLGVAAGRYGTPTRPDPGGHL